MANVVKTAQMAFKVAEKKGPDFRTRNIASKYHRTALAYAMKIDKGPHEVTRKGALKDPQTFFLYCVMVDNGIHEELVPYVKGKVLEGNFDMINLWKRFKGGEVDEKSSTSSQS